MMNEKVYTLFKYFHECLETAEARKLCKELKALIDKKTVRGSEMIEDAVGRLPEKMQHLIVLPKIVESSDSDSDSDSDCVVPIPEEPLNPEKYVGDRPIFTLLDMIREKYKNYENIRIVSGDLVILVGKESLSWTDPIKKLETYDMAKIVTYPSLFKTVFEILHTDSEKRTQFALQKYEEFMTKYH